MSSASTSSADNKKGCQKIPPSFLVWSLGGSAGGSSQKGFVFKHKMFWRMFKHFHQRFGPQEVALAVICTSGSRD